MSYQDKKILIVEDDDLLRQTLVPELSTHFTVFTAADGQEALELIPVHRPDVIILDLLMPNADGFDVLKALRAMSDTALSKTPVIVLSNLQDLQNIIKAQQYGIKTYITKSEMSMRGLVTQIQKTLDDKPGPDAIELVD